MKRVACISPHFPPVNAADMHRLRQALPHMRDFGWEPVVFAVRPDRIEMGSDELLLRTVPADVEVRYVEALPAALTRVAGIGNLGFRSWFSLKRAVDEHLAREPVDLIFFTTTVFASIAHGPGWKRRHGVPIVVDLQDPWRNDYYLSLPRKQRPRKFWFDHWQKTELEARTMPHVDGLMAVSEAYIRTMRARYPALCDVPTMTLPFGVEPSDLDVARKLRPVIEKSPGTVNAVYVGRGGPDMTRSLSILFKAVADGLRTSPEQFRRLRFHFLGTSYAPDGRGQDTVLPVARRFGLGDQVAETTDRLPYFQALRALLDADFLAVPGSDDRGYTASKIFPYVLSRKPLLAIFHEESSVVSFVRATNAGEVLGMEAQGPDDDLVRSCTLALRGLLEPGRPKGEWDPSVLEPHLARAMTEQMCELFDATLQAKAGR